MKKKKQELEILNPNAADIDIGSRSHYVAIGPSDDLVREFGIYSSDHQEMIHWLKENHITSIAMESTGSYWQNLFVDLNQAGFELTLTNGSFIKNIKGKKTDVKDCQWIQKLHSLGLLSSSFLPDAITDKLRTYTRHRSNLLIDAGKCSQKMGKYLRLMNLRLDVVVNDICGLTGLRIIQSVCDGENDPQVLAELRHWNCKKSKQEIARALQSNGREDYLFALQQEFESYTQIQERIKSCDEKIKQFFEDFLAQNPHLSDLQAEKKVYKKVNKNVPKNIDINQLAYQYFNGVDLMAIEGVSHNTVLSIMGELGLEGFKKFNTAKQFASWLRLAPNNKISGGKILSSKVPRGSNRVKIALRQAANAIGNLKGSYMYDFFIRICIRKGRPAAITAVARKLARIIWIMVTKRVPYNPPRGYEFLEQKRRRKVKQIRKLVNKLQISPHELDFASM